METQQKNENEVLYFRTPFPPINYTAQKQGSHKPKRRDWLMLL